MTHHLLHYFCRRLRDAGLPQPENPEFGQIWVRENDTTFIYSRGQTDLILSTNDGAIMISYEAFKAQFIFHPSIEYLLQHLPNEMTLRRDSHGKWYFGTEKMDGLKITGFEAIAEADTPLQAAALAYLHLHEKTSAP